MLNPPIDNEMMNAFNKLIPFLSIAASIEELTTSSKVLEEMAQET